MENIEDNKEDLSKKVNSDYYGYLIGKKINEVLKQKWGSFQYFVYALLAVLTFFGFDIWKKTNAIDDLKVQFSNELSAIKHERDSLNRLLYVKTDDIRSRLDSQNTKIDLQSGALFLQDKKIEFQDKTFEQSISFSNLYHDIFNDQLQQTKNLRDDIQSSSSKYSAFTDSINRKIADYRSQYNSLNSLRDSIKGRIADVERKTDENTINSSLKYIYAERSDRLTETFINAFKPAVYFLPGRPDTLTFVFYNAEKIGRSDKLVQIDVYRNKVKLQTSPIEFTERGGQLLPREPQELNIGNDIYEIEPVFIYLPPNIGGALIIPDFVVLKISLRKK